MRYHASAARVTSRAGYHRRVSGKRRLPILQSPGGAGHDDAPERAAWQWVGFGAGTIFVAWLPLSAVALALASRVVQKWDLDDHAQLARAGIAIGILYTLAIALGAIGGGFIVGRWGGSGVGVAHAAMSGVAAAVIATALSSASFGFTPRSLLVAVVAVPTAAIGGALGRRRRAR